MRLFVTGGTGFVGRALLARCESDAISVIGTYRGAYPYLPMSHVEYIQADLTDQLDGLSDHLRGIDAVIHLAARAHQMKDSASDSLTLYRKANVTPTLALARCAAEAGVKRFVYISSIKVNGERTDAYTAFTEDDVVHPEDPYGLSKWEAEQGLHQIAAQTGLEVVIIRPPLVYGPGVKGNMKALARLVKRGFPLPLGGIENKRSIVSVTNLVDLILLTTTHPRAANQTFLVSDGVDLSTSDLLQYVACAGNTRLRLIPIPVNAVSFLLRSLGKTIIAERLFGSLRVDITYTTRQLGWKPVSSIENEFKHMLESWD
ncbi:NAD-dependent epimerase/dehydratase family protein [Vibrio sp. S4M6]|uniref:NAD-dependent epimerase/dehydratase family protein n=1 Tax=Vibrio sinus TaxID=2946865 RepID=UPI00202ABF09|nr:NAD-dependent epimerase/dehydratase family protein [Vibrio sinus]MCL9781533.1 NAD-dependent epimerase/dehydratase family protein [Vibrio sinus]